MRYPSEAFTPVVSMTEKTTEITNIQYKKINKPMVSMIVLAIILAGCLFADFFIPYDPFYMDLSNYGRSPSIQFLFGTDLLGRDIFSMIWYGGRCSLIIGMVATALSTTIAVVYGTASGVASDTIDSIMMRLTEIILSIPSILIIIFVQGMVGRQDVITIAIVIGATSWMSMAKVIRTEVRQLRSSEYITAAKSMGASFFHILWKHLLPNFISSILFMMVMNIRSAMITESTLSFFGIGLPIEVISWGSMLSLSDKALLSNSWWLIVIPGVFLVVTIVCITNIAEYVRKKMNGMNNNL